MEPNPPFPPQPGDTPWPDHAWPCRPELAIPDLTDCADRFFADPHAVGETRALLVVHRGAIVVERYGAGVDAGTTLPSWSMAKSVLHALVGLLVRDGVLDLSRRAGSPEWRESDPRSEITLAHLVHMSSGLAFREEYVRDEQSDVIPMLFGPGKTDVASFAASFPLIHAPGTVWSYSSGTSNIISGAVRRALGGLEPYRHYLHTELLERIGMRSAKPRFDDTGTWIGSSFLFATARDFARFALLYLRDGVWDGDRVLPPGWADYARTPAPSCPTGEYGAHWWIDTVDPGIFYASGYQGQRIVLDPAHDVALVRLGVSQIPQRDAINALCRRIIGAFPRVSETG